MKISLSFVIRTLAVLNLFLPVCTAICYGFGYKFSLFNYSICSVIFAAISVAGIVYSFISKEKICKKSDTAMLAFLPLLSVINCGLYLYESKMEFVTVKICIAVWVLCSAIIAIKYVRPIILKIVSIAIASLSILPVVLFVGLLLEPFPKITVIKTLPSPKKTYYAEVTDVDQGALGGNTLVRIHKTKKLDFLLFNIAKTPERVYLGDWKDYEDMQIYWINEHLIEIDEIEYTVE